MTRSKEADPRKDAEPIKVDGKKEASALLAALDPSTRNRILAGISQSDPTLADTLKKGMATFEQLIHLEPRQLMLVIQKFPPALVALSLRGLSPEHEALWFSKIPERLGRALRDERDSMGPQKKSDVDAAREKLVDYARGLHESGAITLYQPKT